MTHKNIIIGFGIAIVVLAGAAWAYTATQKETASDTATTTTSSQGGTGNAQGKVAAATVADGTYYATVKSANENPEDAVATFAHVTFFEGAEAAATAKLDVKCEGDIQTCVPSVAQGYYVRKSGSPDFTAPILKSAKISLAIKANATVADLADNIAVKSYVPVYKVTIKGGAATSIVEVSKP